jgi:hypothetical protein
MSLYNDKDYDTGFTKRRRQTLVTGPNGDNSRQRGRTPEHCNPHHPHDFLQWPHYSEVMHLNRAIVEHIWKRKRHFQNKQYTTQSIVLSRICRKTILKRKNNSRNAIFRRSTVRNTKRVTMLNRSIKCKCTHV